MKRRIVTFLLGTSMLIFSTGCVSEDDLTDLKANQDYMQTQIERLQDRVSELESDGVNYSGDSDYQTDDTYNQGDVSSEEDFELPSYAYNSGEDFPEGSGVKDYYDLLDEYRGQSLDIDDPSELTISIQGYSSGSTKSGENYIEFKFLVTNHLPEAHTFSELVYSVEAYQEKKGLEYIPTDSNLTDVMQPEVPTEYCVRYIIPNYEDDVLVEVGYYALNGWIVVRPEVIEFMQ
jgi:hypothetical protein